MKNLVKEQFRAKGLWRITETECMIYHYINFDSTDKIIKDVKLFKDVQLFCKFGMYQILNKRLFQ